MADIIDCVARAIQAKCTERGYTGCPAPLVYHVAAAAIEAADAFRAEEKRAKQARDAVSTPGESNG